MRYTEPSTSELKNMIIDLAEEIRLKTLRYGYRSRHIKIVIPAGIRAALGDFKMDAYGGFTFSVEYDPHLVDDIFVYPVMPGSIEHLGCWQFRQFVTRWMDRFTNILP